ncbi:MAG TPA: SseB family protein [Streptosporangiaceae bacterium]|nr:SseB family protein [Streptosporangiaceae bacterium]
MVELPGVELSGGDARYRDDHGGADPAVAAAMAAYAAGTGGEHAVLVALAGSRLLVPVVAVLADEPGIRSGAAAGDGCGHGGAGGRDGTGARPPAGARGLLVQGEKASEMAMPSIIGRDGRPALPAFTCVDAVRRWQPAARPVPVPAAGVWQSAVQESCAVVIDLAGPVPLAIEGVRLAAMAAGLKPPAMHEDPDVWHQVAAAAAEVAPGIRIRLSAAPADMDFTLELAPPAGAIRPVPEYAAGQIAEAATARLAGRVRAGIAVIVQPPG